MDKTVTASEARKNFFALLKAIKTPGVSVTITHGGHPAGVLLSAEEFDGWMETMDIMSDPKEYADLLDTLRNIDNEEKIPLEEIMGKRSKKRRS